MHNTLVFATFPLHSSVFYHSTERFVKFGAVLHHDLTIQHAHILTVFLPHAVRVRHFICLGLSD